MAAAPTVHPPGTARIPWHPDKTENAMLSPAYVAALARYNRWANERLYHAVAGLTDSEYRKTRPSFFGSIRNTLNHLLVGDKVWMARFEGGASGIASLDQILHDDFDSLRRARAAEDARIVAALENFDAAKLSTVLVYRSLTAGEARVRYDLGLAHMFNHQTHHRGQVHDQLSATDVAPPPLDFIHYVREHMPA
ncbi:MAG: DinB family protein [Alphaproteobacteria bacterium]